MPERPIRVEALTDIAAASEILNNATALMTCGSPPALEEWVAPAVPLDQVLRHSGVAPGRRGEQRRMSGVGVKVLKWATALSLEGIRATVNVGARGVWRHEPWSLGRENDGGGQRLWA
jgi:hypothetical protein